MSEFSIEVQKVTVSFGKNTVLDNIFFQVERGKTFSLLGPSGCGKTTLLRALAGLGQIDSGTITLHSAVVSGRKTFVQPERRDVGMVFQSGALFPHLTVQQNVAFGLSQTGEESRRTAEVLELVGLSDFQEHLPEQLSGGQQQRVALARALAPHPKILLLDEPFSALDTDLRVSIRRDVKKILDEVGCTTILVTHDQDEAFLLGDSVAVMNKGSIRQIGSPKEIYESPTDPWVASFVGDANLVEGVLEDAVAETCLGSISVHECTIPAGSEEIVAGSDVVLAIRPEQIELSSGDTAKVVEKQYFGHDVLYTVEFLVDSVLIDVRSVKNLFTVGDQVDLEFVGVSAAGWFR